jgi:hypothetical protein
MSQEDDPSKHDVDEDNEEEEVEQEKELYDPGSSDEDSEDNDHDEDDDDDDPRIDAMLARAGVPEQDSSKSNTQQHPLKIQVSETAILECFQRAIDGHDPNPQQSPAAQQQRWQAPPLFPSTTSVVLKDWQPAQLEFPTWVKQLPPPTAAAAAARVINEKELSSSLS